MLGDRQIHSIIEADEVWEKPKNLESSYSLYILFLAEDD